jgi:hypothetical protein
MARTLAFNFDGQPFRCAVDKVEEFTDARLLG